jgi:hypothetical protein
MDREHQNEDIIDLGAISVETKGPSGFVEDTQVGRIPAAGLNAE